MVNYSLKTIEKIKTKWMVGYTDEMICKDLKMSKKTYRDYEVWILKLLNSRLFKLAKDGYITTMLDSMEKRGEMADMLKDKIEMINKKMNEDNTHKLIYPLNQAIGTWNNVMDSRDELLNQTPMLQAFHRFIDYNIKRGQAPEIPPDVNVPIVDLVALPEMVPKQKRKRK